MAQLVYQVVERTLSQQPGYTITSVEGDVNSNRIHFIMNRMEDGVDLSTKDIFVVYRNKNQEGSEDACVNIETDANGETFSFDWYLSAESTSVSGDLIFQVVCRSIDENNKISYQWSTLPETLKTQPGVTYTQTIAAVNLSEQIALVGTHTTHDTLVDEGDPIPIVGRTIQMPTLTNVIVAKDANSQVLTFTIDRYQDGIDISDKTFYFKFKNSKGQGNRRKAVNVVSDSTKVTFCWLVGALESQVPGELSFEVEILGSIFTDEFYCFQTLPAYFTVERSIDYSEIINYGEDSDYILQDHESRIQDLESGTSGGGSGTGADGKSAYEIAVENGYEGTEAEWLASLKGASATIAIGTVTTGAPGTQASVINSGTPGAAVLDITIPRGANGEDAPASVDVSSVLYGKKLSNFGDSIAAGVGNSNDGVNPYGYVQMIADRNGMTLYDHAVGGYKMSQILTSLNNASETDADYVLLEGGYNDANPSGLTTMGTLSSGYTATLDTTTFYGALESLLKTAQAKYPSAKIVYVIVHRTKRTQWPDYAEAIKAACEKWSIPCVNLMESGGLNSNIDAMLNAYTDSVGVHPNEAGYLKWYVPPVEAKLRELTSHAVQVYTYTSSSSSTAYEGDFTIPGTIPANVQKISQYTVNGLSMEAGTMTVGTQEITLPALGKWDTLTATSAGAGTIARQSVKKLLSEFSWNLISTSADGNTLFFGCTTASQYIPAADLPANDGAELTCVYSPDFTLMTVSGITGANTEGIAFKSTGSPRLRVLASRLTDAGHTADLTGLNSYLSATGNYIVYKATEQTTESVTLDALTEHSGTVTLSSGYTGGTMTAVKDEYGGSDGDDITINTDTTTEIALAHNTEYRRGEVSSLTISLPSTIPERLDCMVAFSTGSTAPTVTLPSGMAITGDDVSGGAFSPAANKRYNLMIWYDGVMVWCSIVGVSIASSDPEPTTYSITYEENGGTTVADQTGQTNLPDPLPSITYAGHTFGGWFTDSGYSTAAVAGATLTANVTLYAKWTETSSGGTGTGTEADPYIIASATDFKALADSVDGGDSKSGKYYKLTSDIDLSDYTAWNPIGGNDKTGTDASAGFAGTLDGAGHTIKNLNVSEVQYAGLFGTNFTGVVMNLGIESGEINTSTANSTCGAIARKMTASGAKIVNCYSLIPCTAVARSSGLVDEMADGAMLIGCYQAALVGGGSGYALKGATTATGSIHYCLWDSDKTANGLTTTTDSSNNTGLTTTQFATAAATLNDNLSAVATKSGIDASKLCTWTNGTNGYPALVVKA